METFSSWSVSSEGDLEVPSQVYFESTENQQDHHMQKPDQQQGFYTPERAARNHRAQSTYQKVLRLQENSISPSCQNVGDRANLREGLTR